MAKRIEGPYDFSRYNFATYADGATWELTEGEDFAVKPDSVVNAARRWAEHEGLEVEAKKIEATPKVAARVALRFHRINGSAK
jgi:hypothetical protein